MGEKLVDAGVVDQDVEPTESFLMAASMRSRAPPPWIRLHRRQRPYHRAAVIARTTASAPALTGCVIDDDGSASAANDFGDGSSDNPWMRR